MKPPELNDFVVSRQKLIGDNNNSFLDRFMDTVGDETGTFDMAVAADEFLITPDEGYIYLIDEVNIVYGDITAGFSITGFGGGAALGNGMNMEIRRNGNVEKTIFEDMTTNLDLITLGKTQWVFTGANETLLSINIIEQIPIRLNSDEYSLVIETQDDMSFLDYMKTRIKGRYYKQS